MVYDPTNEKYRKPRRLGNTPLKRYIGFIAFSVTSLYALALYMHFRRDVLPYVNIEQRKKNEDDIEMLFDYVTQPFLRGTIEKLIEGRESKAKEPEAALKDTHVDK